MILQEKLFSQEEVNIILSYTDKYKTLFAHEIHSITDLENNRIGLTDYEKESNPSFLKKYTCFDIPRNNETEWLFSKLLNWFSKNTGIEVREDREPGTSILTLHKYLVGDGFGKHIDYNPKFPNRIGNVGVQLNNTYEGGDYYVYKHLKYDNYQDREHISKEPGTAVYYDISYLHEITKITSGERWSLVFPITSFDVMPEKRSLL